MKAHEAIKFLCDEKAISRSQVTKACGLADSTIRTNILYKYDFKSATLASIAAVFGYKLCLVPDKDVPKSALIISPKESE